MTAAYRLKGIGWFGACTAIVLGFYLVSLQVASERKKLEHLDADIASTRRDIRALETEFDTRSNLAQLERWNGDTLALSAPVPAQFLRDADELASADVIRGVGAPAVRTAALIVPSFAAPAPSTPLPAGPLPAASPASAPARAALAQATVRRTAPALAPVRVAVADTAREPHPVRAALVHVAARLPRLALTRASFEADGGSGDDGSARVGTGVARARPQVALLDRKLLSDTTLRDLVGGARAEGGKLR